MASRNPSSVNPRPILACNAIVRLLPQETQKFPVCCLRAVWVRLYQPKSLDALGVAKDTCRCFNRCSSLSLSTETDRWVLNGWNVLFSEAICTSTRSDTFQEPLAHSSSLPAPFLYHIHTLDCVGFFCRDRAPSKVPCIYCKLPEGKQAPAAITIFFTQVLDEWVNEKILNRY